MLRKVYCVFCIEGHHSVLQSIYTRPEEAKQAVGMYGRKDPDYTYVVVEKKLHRDIKHLENVEMI